MNKYTELSDFEINKKVSELIFISDEYEVESSLFGHVTVNDEIYDPCNNPSDAMPIIIENKIGLSPMYHSNKWTADCLDYDFMSVNKNPYRGAMEVFLMMKDTENNQ
ncbi:TPA: phage protein NinX family protein [Proteus mirabilis]|uniref:phage protein NinX family protein n=1 Tax=Proteus mirabilis TaxID=584 RepID=UPI0005075E0D|nr:phage protein NinX family protein [Proteus mirabilis]EKW0545978.1 DUF2591 domain-containing protein [Proteus mirabilis]EKW4850218.1 DUF2591 domain-containing protein [Proteus mirabilis]EKY0562027.1 DUF2591 domain-containing protein [Proteus mirabilis]ELA7909388.1 DUF2591 domain-containing protein [Proteus mirabilis]ELA9092818.1 DUF2591 domain-containing protein [Proteus mirabilis]